MEQERKLKKKGKGTIFQKSELEATWRRYATLFQVDSSKAEKRDLVSIHEDDPFGYCGLTQGQCPSSSVCTKCQEHGS